MRESLLNLIIYRRVLGTVPAKNRPEVGKRAQMWKDKQKVLEGQVEQVAAELTKVRSW